MRGDQPSKALKQQGGIFGEMGEDTTNSYQHAPETAYSRDGQDLPDKQPAKSRHPLSPAPPKTASEIKAPIKPLKSLAGAGKRNWREGKPPLLCPLCGEALRDAFGLKRHLNSTKHTEKRPQKRLWQCDICLGLFLREDRLRTHIQAKHLNPKKNAYQCDICLKSFSRVDRLRSHQKTHLHNSKQRNSNQNRSTLLSSSPRTATMLNGSSPSDELQEGHEDTVEGNENVAAPSSNGQLPAWARLQPPNRVRAETSRSSPDHVGHSSRIPADQFVNNMTEPGVDGRHDRIRRDYTSEESAVSLVIDSAVTGAVDAAVLRYEESEDEDDDWEEFTGWD
jgi:C2H2-type zinc finger